MACEHVYHQACLRQSLQAQVEGLRLPLVCPEEGCGRAVGEWQARAVLDRESFGRYLRLSLTHCVDRNLKEYSWCPTADCQYVFFHDGERDFHCPLCRHRFCLACRTDWHQNLTCEEYRATRDPVLGEQRFLEFVAGAKFKQCPNCRLWVEKDDGCNSLTCRCGIHFCYRCGGIQDGDHGKCACHY